MIIFLYGEDSFSSRRKLNILKERFLKEVDSSGNSLSIIDGSTASLEKINELISPSSLLAEKRMVVIEDLFKNKKNDIFDQIFVYFKNKKNEDNIIIFWDSLGIEEKVTKNKDGLLSFLKKQKFSIPFKTLSNTEVTNWARKEVEARGGKISVQAAATLASYLGSNLWQINSEIDKLINYKAGQKLNISDNEKGSIIEKEDVENMVRGNFDEKIFALTDALSAKNKALAVKLLEEQIDAGLTDEYLLSMITRQFKILLQIRQALDTGENQRKIASVLKIHPFVAQKGMVQARNFNLPVLKNIFKKLVEIDYSMKSGQGDIKSMLNLLIAKI